ncbi:unnamed protein product [Orchesella dallaii]|uniref:Hairy/enhancer-of-split related with YRPW motif protein n=1 Tax=Orchesella dallaii TaxID=48710 RepID=A0ABP1Q536_9HEXA
MNLNFATVAVEDSEYGFPKKKTVRDPLSHRIIEKRRRDRMNNCLADLARLLPPSSLRKGRGRIEKTEIVELAIKHLRHLQCHPCPMGEKCEYGLNIESQGGTQNSSPPASCSSSSTSSGYQSTNEEQFRLGFQECLSEAMHFLVEQEGLYAGDTTCVRLVKHLNNHCETLMRDHWGTQGKIVPGFRRVAESNDDFKKQACSGGSSSSGYHPNGCSSGSDGNGGNDGEGTDSFALPVQNQSQHMNVEGSRNSSLLLDYEAENSCSSNPLSIETSDVLSSDGKNNGRSSKPPIPSIICGHSSSNNSGSPATGSNGRSSDDGSANSSASFAHRYKFKSNIKQRFTADCQVKDDGTGFPPGKAEGDGDVDCASDTEERDEGISVIEDPSTPRHLQPEEEGESNGNQHKSSSRRRSIGASSSGGASTPATVQQISADGSVATISDQTAFSSSATSSSNELKSSIASSSSSAVAKHTPHVSHDVTEVKPSTDELLLSAVSALQNANCAKAQLPVISSGDISISEGKGVPAFVLHEKGLFYVPLTIDKSLVSQYSKADLSTAPPLYPVTISVCFVLSPDKKPKLESIPELAIGLSTPDKPTDYSQLSQPIPHAPLSIISGSSGSSMKSNRRVHRESNNFIMNRYGHGHLRQAIKDANSTNSSHSRSDNTAYNYQVLPLPPASGFEVVSGNSDANSSTAFHTMYHHDPNQPRTPITSLNEKIRMESDGSGTSYAGGSSSGSSSVGNGGRGGRKRSISSSPSMAGSGGSLGYHSWHEKGSPSSHEYYNYHANTHTLQAMAQGRIPPSVMSPMEHRHGQNLNPYHAENILREKELGYRNDKRSKKSKSIDQTIESKQ